MGEKEKAGKDLPLQFVKGRLVLTLARLVGPSSSLQCPQQQT